MPPKSLEADGELMMTWRSRRHAGTSSFRNGSVSLSFSGMYRSM